MINRSVSFFVVFISVFFLILFFSISSYALVNVFQGPYESRRVVYREPLKESRTNKFSTLFSFKAFNDFQSVHGTKWDIKLDRLTLAPMLISGEGIPLLTDGMKIQNVEIATRGFIDENRELLKVGNDELVLNVQKTKNAGNLGEMWFVHFIQTHNGVPVLDSDVFFRFKFGRLIQFGSESFPGIDIDTRPSISSAETLNKAMEAVNFKDTSDKVVSSGELFIYPILLKGKFVYRLAHKSVILKADPYGEWIVYVDAHKGETLEKYHNISYFAGRLVGYVHPRLAEDRYMDVPLRNVLVNVSDMEEVITDHKGIFGARFDNINNISMYVGGPYAVSKQCDTVYVGGGLYTSCDGIATKVVFNADESWNFDDGLIFSLDDSNTTSAERDSFFYVSRAVDWAARFIRTKWFSKKLTVNVNIKEMVEETIIGPLRKKVACNAFWDGKTINLFVEGEVKTSTGRISCNNVANIADVVFHEWGHGLDENTGGIDDAVFSEGIADTVAFIMTGDSRIGLSFYKEPDPMTGGTFLRDVSVKKVYPRDKNSDPHIESLIISGAWWDLKDSLVERYGFMEGNDRTSYLFLNHILTARKYTQSYSAALFIDDDDGNLANGTPNADLIRAAFAGHGLALD